MPTVPTISTHNPHPLPPDGSYREGRLPAALHQDYVRVDEWEDADWVDLSRRLADLLVYFDGSNTADGNWRPFFSGQPAVETARLLAWPLNELSQLLSDHRERIEDRQESIDKALLLSSLFDAVASVAFHLDRLTQRLPADSPLRQRADAVIRHQLGPALRRWLTYFQARKNQLPDSSTGNLPPNLRKALAVGGTWIRAIDLLEGNIRLRDAWAEPGTRWVDFVSGPIPTDDVVYGSSGDFSEETIHAVGHTFFHGAYEAFVSATLYLRSVAQKEWIRLQNDPGHAPHIALLLAFLQARQRQRELLNGLTDKHLDFYYNRVLRTRQKPAQMPRALLHLEARKNVKNTFLPEGTVFRGDKDEVSKLERQFRSLADLTVTGAVLEEQRALRKVGDEDTTYAPTTRGKLFAASVFNAVDGVEEVAAPTVRSFHPFGYRSTDGNGKLVPGMLPARYGLAIASHFLYLREGDRTITLVIEGIIDELPSGLQIPARLTTEEGWLDVFAETGKREDGELLLTIELTGGDPAIVPYDAAVHGDDLVTKLPVCQLLFHAIVAPPGRPYRDLRFLRPSGVQLIVSADNIRNNVLSGSGGVLDPSKPFNPFGPTPGEGDVLYVGNQEVFQKAGANIKVEYGWKENAISSSKLQLELLKNGSFSSVSGTVSVGATALLPPTFTADTPYAAGSPKGYLALKVTEDLGFQDYLEQLRNFINDPDNEEVPTPPPGGPEMSYLRLDYRAEKRLEVESELHFLTPFGSYAVPEDGALALVPPLLPEHNLGADAGAMLLGFAGWEPGSQLSLAVKVADGTANPLLRKPDNHLRWHYLRNNEWVNLEGRISDGTKGLLESGIVRIDLPYDLQLSNTRFGDNRVWLRMGVGEVTDGLNWVQGIHPNGVEVVMNPDNGAMPPPGELAEGVIKKLLYPQPGVKKVHQPYPSFGGTPREGRDAYFTRLSERLRHKDRGITEWDIEHLILEEFPEVERIICLQHLEYEPGEEVDDAVYHELRAGHFTLLPLGKARGLLPYVSLATRESIAAFVRTRTNAHATVHVRNPNLERVTVTATVFYLEGTDKNQADGQIQADLRDYLSPWQNAGLGQLNFSASVHRSAVINFIEELSYVDYVTELRLSVPNRPLGGNPERISPSNLVSVLISADQHVIDGRFSERTKLAAEEQCPVPTLRQTRGGLLITPKDPKP